MATARSLVMAGWPCVLIMLVMFGFFLDEGVTCSQQRTVGDSDRGRAHWLASEAAARDLDRGLTLDFDEGVLNQDQLTRRILRASLPSPPPSPPPPINQSADAEVLLDFKKGLTDSKNVLRSWNASSTSLCSSNWTGVVCNSRNQVSVLNLSRLELSGGISSSLGGLGFLTLLDLSNNHFNGSIPSSISNCSSLRILNLGSNLLVGPVPSSLTNLTSLTSIDLGLNQLTGSLALDWGSFSQLQTIDLQSNKFSGNFPAALSNCSSLVRLNMSTNFLEGELDGSWEKLVNLTILDLSANALSGSISPALGNLAGLQYLDLSSNNLTGQIPPELGNLTGLQYLDLGSNNFTGGISTGFGNLSQLQELYLYDNQLSGSIPKEIGNLRKLKALDLFSNLLVGEIPASLATLSRLVILDLSDNSLAGEIPASLANCALLIYLDLSNNRLNGSIFKEIGMLSVLQFLFLSSNKFSGTVPATLNSLTSLQFLDLSNNALGGSIFRSLSNLSSLRYADVAANNFDDMLDPNAFAPFANLSDGLNISHNRLSGPIPASVGNLVKLESLDMSFNNFSGMIPLSLSNCITLEHLDLSNNSLDGQIPMVLTDLTFLSSLDLANNNLTGPIPTGGQFRTFPSTAFAGNPGLCGPEISAQCDAQGQPQANKKSSCSGPFCNDRMWIVIVPGVVAAIAVLLIVGACWFLCSKGKGPDNGATVAPVVPVATHFSEDYKDLSIGDIMAATNGFNDTNIAGIGSKSTVYAGVLPAGAIIAVKRFEISHDDKSTFQLLRELQRLSQLEHPNLLTVHAFFCSGDLKALVLEHMANGSLRKNLHDGDRCRLTWAQRLDIAIGVAEGLVYLHNVSSKPVLHLDLKPSNILLDAEMEPKLADYGISRFVNHETHADATISSNLYGSIGYIPPEYGASTAVSTKGDVYNFGIVLMELFTRKQPTDDMFGHELSLRSWVVASFPDSVSTVLDSVLQHELTQCDQELGIHLLVRLSIACTRNVPRDRPSMIEARDMLLEIKSFLPLPPKSPK